MVPPEFDLARSAAVYAGPLRDAICALKFRGRRVLAAPLGRLLADLAPLELTAGVTAVVPVPLHWHRLSSRGFNQADLLARPLAERLGVPCLRGALRRVRQEEFQEDLGAEARRQNVYGAFAAGPEAVRGRVLLVDDVFSTGATAAACSRVLRARGASAVMVYTLARALLRADMEGGPRTGRPAATRHVNPASEEGRDHGASGGRAGGLASVRR